MKCECSPRMRNSLTIQAPNDSATAGASGHIDLSNDANWLTKDTRKCHIFTRGGAEKWRFNQVEAEVSRIVHFKYGPLTRQINPRWRLVYRDGSTDKKWDIATAFDVDGQHKTIEVHVKEVV